MRSIHTTSSGVYATIDSYDKRGGCVILLYQFLKIAHRVYADHCVGLSEVKNFIVTIVHEKKTGSGSLNTYYSFHVCTKFNDNLWREFAFVNYFGLQLSSDSAKQVLNYLCLRRTTEIKIDSTLRPNLNCDDNIIVEKRHGIVPFSFIHSVHHVVR